MASVTRTRTIAVRPEAVWGVLADFGEISRWADFVDHSSMLRAGPLAVGATRRVQAGRMVLLERIVDIDSSLALEYEIEGLPSRISSVRNRWEVRPAEGDATAVSVTTTVAIGSRPPQRLAERIVGRGLARRADAMLTGLADHLSTTHAEQARG